VGEGEVGRGDRGGANYDGGGAAPPASNNLGEGGMGRESITEGKLKKIMAFVETGIDRKDGDL